MKIISVVGARPNFMKIAPFIRAIDSHNNEGQSINHILVHTGQHYDDRMSRTFFEALNIPDADINLNIGSGSHAEQVGNTMIAFEKTLLEEKPDWVVVVGDVNATLACSVTAKKLQIKVCHIEAGLRSGDEKMPEEINRLVTDRLSDLLLTPDEISTQNLREEGVEERKIKYVGNIMIDTLVNNLDQAKTRSVQEVIDQNLLESAGESNNLAGMDDASFALLTMHRPSNVDHQEILTQIVSFLTNRVASQMRLIWPIHPRTEKQLKRFDLFDQVINNDNIVMLKPVGYHEMLRLNLGAEILLTDSGGLQEESCVLGTPCITLRWNTERPITLREHGGVSILAGNDVSKMASGFDLLLKEQRKPFTPDLWDGKTAQRCLKAILDY